MAKDIKYWRVIAVPSASEHNTGITQGDHSTDQYWWEIKATTSIQSSKTIQTSFKSFYLRGVSKTYLVIIHITTCSTAMRCFCSYGFPLPT